MGRIVAATPTNGRLSKPNCIWTRTQAFEDGPVLYGTSCDFTGLFGAEEGHVGNYCSHCGKPVFILESNDIVYEVEDGVITGEK